MKQACYLDKEKEKILNTYQPLNYKVFEYSQLSKDFNESYLNDLKCIYFCGEQLEVKTVKKILLRFEKVALE